MLAAPPPQYTHKVPAVFLGHAEGEGHQEDAGEQPLRAQPPTRRTTAPCPAPPVPELGCPWRARTRCPRRPHTPAGSLWGSMSEGVTSGVEKGSGTRWDCPLGFQNHGGGQDTAAAAGTPGTGRGGGGAATVCPSGTRAGVAPGGPTLTRPSAARPGPQGRRRACPCRRSGPGSSHRPCQSP